MLSCTKYLLRSSLFRKKLTNLNLLLILKISSPCYSSCFGLSALLATGTANLLYHLPFRFKTAAEGGLFLAFSYSTPIYVLPCKMSSAI